MELLNPSWPPHSPKFTSPASFSPGFGRFGTSQSAEIVEEDENNNNKVHVALGKSVEKAMSLLDWALRRFHGKEVCILHVHQPSLLIPTHIGKFPASQASAEVVSTYRKYEREQLTALLKIYLSVCSRAKVNASFITIEAEQVQKGIVELVNKNCIRRLVMGAVPENCMKVKKSSSKANYAAKYAPLFCEIWFINKGKHVWTRDASRGPYPPSCSLPQIPTVEISRSRSFQYSGNKSIHPACPQSKSAKSAVYDQISNQVQYERVHAKLASSSTLSCSTNACLHDINDSSSTSSSSTGSGYESAERRLSDSGFKFDKDRLYNQLIQATIDAEASRNEALEVSLKIKKLELEAREAISKVKEFESAIAREVKLRKEGEEALRTTLREQEKLLEERDDITQELRKTMRNVALLDSRAQEANRRHDEAAGELKLVQESIASLRQEKQQIRRQKIEALHWLERWRSRGQGGASTCNGLVGFVEELPELAEFSLTDLQTATCNFSESFKVGQGGHCSIYKGEMLGRTVAIRRLHSYNVQGESEFQQEVKVLGKLQHPHLVTLLGVCQEACSLVYEYLPSGSLEEHLFRKSNILTWKIRVRILAEIASALCFLHSSKPEKVVHGDLTPRKILLDSKLSCKICDFGICRLIAEDNFYCPSLRWNSGPKGAFQYIDPEFQRIGILTPKSDAFSFGLIILQLLTRRSPVGLAGEVRKAHSSGKLASILDFSAGEWPMPVAMRLVEIGLQCCELSSRDRPNLTPCLVTELEQLHVNEERPVPSFFLCPILKEIMHDPQVAADGFTYEGEAMREWLENVKGTSPMTNLKLSHLHLTPNHAIRLAIQDWLCKA